VILFIKNSRRFYKRINNIINERVIVYNKDVHTEMLFVRRLCVDWIQANINLSDMPKYIIFKFSFLKILDSNENKFYSNFKFVSVWKDFNIFIRNHGDFFLDIYESSVANSNIIYKHRLFMFSVICVILFYKWRKKRNDAIRHWLNYKSRRKKKKFDIDISSFDNFILNEARKYGDEYREKITEYTP